LCNQPPISLADPQVVHYESPRHQSSSRPPEVSRHHVAVSSAMPHLHNLSILDAAVPTAGLPRPILYSQDLPPSSFHAASPEGQPQSSHVQPLNLQVNPAQPLVSLSPQQRQSPSLMPQSFTSSSHHQEQRSVAPPPGRTHVYKLEGPSFPNLTREDEMQYRMLRMALSNLLDPNETEHFKYHVLLDHLKVDQAKRLALAFSYASDPYTKAIKALDERYGQPMQLALKELRNIMDLPPIRVGDGHALDNFSLRVQALVGLLNTMEDQGQAELLCGSHVDRLLEKLPAEHSSRFKRHVYRNQGTMKYDLHIFSSWVQTEAQCQIRKEVSVSSFNQRPPRRSIPALTTILHGANKPSDDMPFSGPIPRSRATCAYCSSLEHHVSKCPAFIAMTKDQKVNWIKEKKRCW